MLRADGSCSLADDLELVQEALFADIDPQRAAEARARMLLQSEASAYAEQGPGPLAPDDLRDMHP